MLHPESDVSHVYIEGPAPEDEVDFGDGPETFLGVDLTEYHEGSSWKGASRVIVSQLKYGSRRPNRPWTLHILCQGKAGRPTTSVVRRLATAFKAFYDLAAADLNASLQKLSLQIVTNRPLAEGSRRALQRARSILQSQSCGVKSLGFRHLSRARLSSAELQGLRHMHNVSGLSSNEFALFLLSLSISRILTSPHWRFKRMRR